MGGAICCVQHVDVVCGVVCEVLAHDACTQTVNASKFERLGLRSDIELVLHLPLL